MKRPKIGQSDQVELQCGLNYHRMQTYRYEYDKQDRKIEFVIWAQTPLMKRLMFSYDENGEQVVTTEKPGAIYFWD